MITVVIPVLNNLQMTDQLLEDIKKNTVQPLEIILIDNNSSEPMYSLVQKYHTLKITYIKNYENIGVNASWNLGRHLAKGKYISILNNDIRLNPKFFEKIIDSMEDDEKVGLCSITISNSIDKIFTGITNQIIKKYVFEISGFAYTLRKTISDEIGPIPEELFLFFGDNFILSRICQLGYKSIVISNNEIFHYDHCTLSKFTEKSKMFDIHYKEQDIFNGIIKKFKFGHYVWNLENYKQRTIEDQSPTGGIMVYDVFPFMNEFDLLEIRLNELYNSVDKFVIFECKKTFTNLDKPLYLHENLYKYSKFLDKIILIEVEKPEETNPWFVYNIQIDNVIKQIYSMLRDDDIIIISDVDEIPRKDLFTKYTKPIITRNLKHNFYQIQQRMSYYKYNCLADHDWYGSILVNKLGVTQYAPHQFREWRESADGIKIFNGGWHFTYIQTPEEIQQKIRSFAHQEYNTEEYNNLERIKKCTEEGFYLFDWTRKLEFIKFEDLDFPKHLEKNKEKFSRFIKEI